MPAGGLNHLQQVKSLFVILDTLIGLLLPSLFSTYSNLDIFGSQRREDLRVDICRRSIFLIVSNLLCRAPFKGVSQHTTTSLMFQTV